MSTLHTVNASPFQYSVLDSCLRVASVGDSILLLEDGVYALVGTHPYKQQLQHIIDTGLRVYALLPHLQERHVNAPDTIEVVDYDGFVALSTQHQRIQSWYP